MNKLVLAEAKCLGTKNRKYSCELGAVTVAEGLDMDMEWVNLPQMKVRQSTLPASHQSIQPSIHYP